MFWIDIEDTAGNRYGNGPLIDAISWESSLEISKSGTFSFEIPANSLQASLIDYRRVARCTLITADGPVEMGAGIIEKIDTYADETGQVMISVSGDDLMRELTRRQVGSLAVDDGAGGPTTTGPALVMAMAPTGWSLSGSSLTAIMHQFEGETVLNALVRIAEMTGESFRLGVGRQIVWVTSNADSGVRLYYGMGVAAVEHYGTILHITRETDSYDSITRIYPYGVGNGDQRITLVDATWSAPTGYEISTSGNYIRITAETSATRAERYESFKDISVSNTLAEAAYNYLRRRLDVGVFYDLECLLDEIVTPGQTVYVEARQFVDGTQTIDIKADLVILGTTIRLDTNGAIITGMRLGSVDRQPENDTNALVSVAVVSRDSYTHPQPTNSIGGDADSVDGHHAVDFLSPAYVVMSINSNLTQERVLTAGDGLDLSDGGAGLAATLAVDVTDLIDTSYGLTEDTNNIRINLQVSGGLAFATGALGLDTAHARNVDHSTVSITAGDGLTGGGTIAATRTLAVGAGDGIDVSADAVAVDVTDIIDTSYGLTENDNNIRINKGNGLDFSTGALVLGTPSTLTVATTNGLTSTSHTHAITSSSNPGAAASLLASDASGYLQLTRLGIGIAPSYPLHISSGTVVGYLDTASRFWVSANTQAGFISATNSASVNARNWFVGSNDTEYGDFVIRQSNVLGGNPASAGTVRLYFDHSGNFAIGTTSALLGDGTYASSGVFQSASTNGNFLVLRKPDTTNFLQGIYIQDKANYAGWDFGVDVSGNAVIGYGTGANETAAVGAARVDTGFSLSTTGTLTLNKAADVVRLIVKGYAAQTTSILQVQDSTGTARISVGSGYAFNVKYDASNYATLSCNSGGSLTLAATGDLIIDPTGNDVLPNLNYDINLGALSKKYLTLHAAELWVETLVAQDTMATIGGRILVGPTTTLIADLAAGGSTMDVKHNELASGDRVVMESNGKLEWMAVTSAATPITGGYRYSITRNLDGTGANDWYAGDAVFNTGTTGDGFIDLYSLAGVVAGSTAGPSIVGNVRNSATYNDYDEHWAIGNLNGLYGYSSSIYGVGLGKYSASTPYITIEPTNGIRIFNSDATEVVSIDLAGNADFQGTLTAAGGLVVVDDEALTLTRQGYAVRYMSSGDEIGSLFSGQVLDGTLYNHLTLMAGALSEVTMTNPGFESVLTSGWVATEGAFGWITRISGGRSGSYSVQMNAAANAIGDEEKLRSISYAATPNDVAYLSLWYNNVVLEGSAGGASIAIQIEWLDSGSTVLRTDVWGYIGSVAVSTWTKAEFQSSTAPDSTAYVRIYIWGTSAYNTGVKADFDDVTLWVGANDGSIRLGGEKVRLQATTTELSGSLQLAELTTTPGNPTSGSACKLYMKGDKLIIQYNESSTIRYKYLDLTGTGVTWVHTTSAP